MVRFVTRQLLVLNFWNSVENNELGNLANFLLTIELDSC